MAASWGFCKPHVRERQAAAAEAGGQLTVRSEEHCRVTGRLTRLAETDLHAQLAYQDRIRAFHRRLREFYYGYLFRDLPFGKADFARAPRFEETAYE
jgi:hypothetical protein